MKYRDIQPRSASGSLVRRDWDKIIRTFFYSAGSLIVAVTAAILILPEGTIPPVLLPYLGGATLLNVVAYSIVTWAKDNR